jgi:hypothetical protein|tara:strand:- start:397 stop:822 length:426 start_codon:yes stop_codon:yes gene_type:complete
MSGTKFLSALIDSGGGGSSVSFTEDTLSSDFSTTSSSMVDVTGLTITLGDSGIFIVGLNAGLYNTGTAGTAPVMRIMHDTTQIRRLGQGSPAASMSLIYCFSDGGTCDETIVKPQCNAPVSTTVVRGTGDYLSAFFTWQGL